MADQDTFTPNRTASALSQMIKIDFTIAISIYISFFLLLVFGQWIFYNFFRNDDLDFQSAYFQQCPFCTYGFLDYQQNRYKICPRCQSLISVTEPGNENIKSTQITSGDQE